MPPPKRNRTERKKMNFSFKMMIQSALGSGPSIFFFY